MPDQPNKQILLETAQALVADSKGLLAMDESTSTCNKRFAEAGIPQTVESRRLYRELLVTTPQLSESISGAILVDETIRQQIWDGSSMVDVLVRTGIIPGIKVDLGAKPLAGFSNETVTEGLDGLRERLAEYAHLGARFAKWRAVISIGEGRPSQACLEANMHTLARYAALCQEAGLVPIVEPEVLMDGAHSLEECAAVTKHVLELLFAQLSTQGVILEGMLLKPNMVLAGKDCQHQPTTHQVADATVTCLLRAVPAAVAGIAFLSGGQSPEEASAHLNAMNRSGLSAVVRHSGSEPVRFAGQLPWPLTFSFGRALQQPALEIWQGQDANRAAAQKALLNQARSNRAARQGLYLPKLVS